MSYASQPNGGSRDYSGLELERREDASLTAQKTIAEAVSRLGAPRTCHCEDALAVGHHHPA
jgi:hypothetical protein